MKSNKSIGNSFEAELCEILSEAGFWAHNLAQNSAGQPADVIASKGGHAFLIDCKVCTGAYFSKNRIEENQRTSMELWEDCKNGSGLFAVKLSSTIYMIPLWKLDMSDKTNLDASWFMKNATPLADWLREES